MKNLLILFSIHFIIVRIDAFNCSTSKNMSINPLDYRSYYICNNRCTPLNYCQSPQIYFSEETQTCIREPDNWIPRYYLSGTVRPNSESSAILYLRQDGYELIWTYDDSLRTETFIGRYLNETYGQGLLIQRWLKTNCINIFHMDITVTADRQFCAVQRLHPQSALCDLSYPYELNYCRTLSI